MRRVPTSATAPWPLAINVRRASPMSEQQQINRALEARIAELERQLAGQPRRRLPGSRRSHALAALALSVALLVPGVALASHQFSDVPDGHSFHDDIDWLADYGITTGFGDGTFRPSDPVTRGQMARFLHRLSNEFEVVSNTLNPGSANFFSLSAECPGGKRAI